MDTSGAVYARIPPGGLPALDAAISEARSHSVDTSPLGILACDPSRHAFAVVDRWGRSDDMPVWAEDPDLHLAKELCVLSQSVGDVIAFYEIDEGLTMGIYGAWHAGKLVRNLLWAGDQWMHVEGEAQAWEAPLFSAQALQEALNNSQDDSQVRAPGRQ